MCKSGRHSAEPLELRKTMYLTKFIVELFRLWRYFYIPEKLFWVPRRHSLDTFRIITKNTFRAHFCQILKIFIFEDEKFRPKGEFPCAKNYF